MENDHPIKINQLDQYPQNFIHSNPSIQKGYIQPTQKWYAAKPKKTTAKT